MFINRQDCFLNTHRCVVSNVYYSKKKKGGVADLDGNSCHLYIFEIENLRSQICRNMTCM